MCSLFRRGGCGKRRGGVTKLEKTTCFSANPDKTILTLHYIFIKSALIFYSLNQKMNISLEKINKIK
jgi:hypothetical protein